ncbi:MAG: histidinol-phosphate transaminase [Flaviflexus sp.]|uniref:histidinol-phosphate transaminase n=1 Tax=Flaviflexus sp. TaxID=1969482 RepID=UPI003F90508D
MSIPYRPALAGFEPYGAPQLDVPVALNVNENPYAPSPALIADIASAVAGAAGTLNRYPDREFLDLRQDLADYLAVESKVRLAPEQIWAANGSNEVMLHILQAFAGPDRSVLTFIPSYSMYPEYARDTNSTMVPVPRKDDFSIDLAELSDIFARYRPAVVLLASPNNPTGTALSTDELTAVMEASIGNGPEDAPGSDCLVVVDEAYGEFRRDGVPSALELLSTYDNLAVSRTMSKAFGAAGLRLGYLGTSREIVDQLRIVRMPYHLSALTQAAARAALAHSSEQLSQVQGIREARNEMAERLSSLGLEVAPSDANFVMFGTFPDRHRIFADLLDRGILIREVGPDGWLRVSVGTPEENDAFFAALEEALA